MSHHAASDPVERVEELVAHAGHLLPAQGPISVFVHHNTLHAFEHLPFHDAVAAGSALHEAEPYLPEAAFREHFAAGRITEAELDDALAARWRAREPGSAGGLDGRVLERLAMHHRIEAEMPATVRWLVEEGDALRAMRDDVPASCRQRLLHGGRDEAAVLSALWAACRAVPIGAARPSAAPASGAPRVLRDLLLEATGEDANDLVHPILIRLAAGFLDDDSAPWSMPGRERGFFDAWIDLVTSGGTPLPSWLEGLRAEARQLRDRDLTPARVVVDVLHDLGVPEAEWEAVITRVLLLLGGWAGMFRWLEQHPHDRVSQTRPVRLMDFLAVRLLYDRRAWAFVAETHLGFDGPLARLNARLQAASAAKAAQTTRPEHDGAWRLFQVAQLLGLDADAVGRLDGPARTALLDCLDAFPALERRRVWHEAYEAHYRAQVLGAIATNIARPLDSRRVEHPRYQVVFCIDEREESLRRHLEEADPRIETFGAAGFFGLAIQYAGIDDGREVPLCPIVVTPAHVVREVVAEDEAHVGELRLERRRRAHRLRHTSRHASRTLARGTLAMPLLGIASALTLPAQVLAPGLTARIREALAEHFLPEPTTRLLAARSEAEARGLPGEGFTTTEKVDRLATMFQNLGVGDRFARLFCILGHGSESVNNPHISAYECGACGGRQGLANARLFADFANRPHVRKALAERGFVIPDGTWFVGGIHNTASDSITLYDLDRVPVTHRGDLEELKATLDEARARSAHERCRRFESAPRGATPARALRHVEIRSHALFEPRPELGHCTNAACIVGRREVSRGLFLDRRAFLVSYDSTQDPTGAVLERTLAAVGPVGAGISLEYYFSCVDRARYGCGTKLPHNVVAMLGVMDGALSDLRTGLSKQMTEIHEPMRLLLVVEAETSTLEQVAARQEEVRRLVTNQWVQLVSLSPSTGRLLRYTPDGWVEEAKAPPPLPEVSASDEWYAGRIENLAPALVVPGRRRHAA